MKICIVTPDIVGPIRNGGIGTYCLYLARFAKRMGHDVTVLFTGPLEQGDEREYQRYYREDEKVDLVFFRMPEKLGIQVNFPPPTVLRNVGIAQWLREREREFEAVFFQDWFGHGMVAAQMKRCGLAFSRVLLMTTLHSPSEWQREGMGVWPQGGLETLIMDYCERSAVEMSDLVTAPSRHMFSWAEENGWRLPERRKLLPCLLEAMQIAAPSPVSGDDVIFFGRLEFRKGLDIFVGALQKLRPALVESMRTLRVHFLGKLGAVGAEGAEAFITRSLFASEGGSQPFEIHLVTDLGHHEALEYLRSHSGALVVTPSRLDNMPYAVLESATLGLNFLPTAAGGIPEIFETGVPLPAPTACDLAKHLEPALIARRFERLPVAYSPQRAEAVWREFFATLEKEVELASKIPSVFVESPNEFEISVCMPYYNAGPYLREALDSLAAQTHGSFQVIVVDDGSTDSESIRVFDEQAALYPSRGWRFLRTGNGGVGGARNHAASHAEGRFLVFMDADNIAKPSMLAAMRDAAIHSGADCLTCYMQGFEDGDPPEKASYLYLPVGGDLASGMAANVFGDANFIIRREAFDSLGGFGIDRHTSFEDYELLFRLVHSGLRLAVIPEFLFYYRHLSTGFSRITNVKANQMRAIGACLDEAPEWQKRFVIAALGSFLEDHGMWSELVWLRKKRVALEEKIRDLKTTFSEERKQIKKAIKQLQKRKPGLLRRIERHFRKRCWDPLRAWLGLARKNG